MEKAIKQTGGQLTRIASVSQIEMEGMEQHARAFTTYSGKDVRIAQQCALSDRCIKMSTEGKCEEAIDSKGQVIWVDTFRTCMRSKHLRDHGCGLAIELYFNFHVNVGVRMRPLQPPASLRPAS